MAYSTELDNLVVLDNNNNGCRVKDYKLMIMWKKEVEIYTNANADKLIILSNRY